MRKGRWSYWDVLALCAGAAPLFLAMTANLLGLHYGGAFIFLGSAGTMLQFAVLLCVGGYAVGAIAGWRSGNRWFIAGGGLALALCAAPSFLLLRACVSGDCL